MNNPFKRIIQRMGHLLNMYQLVSWVDNDINRHDSENPEVAKVGSKYRLSADGVRDNYSKETKKGNAEIRDLIDSCVEEEYFKTEGRDPVWIFINPGKGRRLLRKFWRIPSGFIKEVISDNSLTLSLISGFVGGLIPLIIYLLTKKPS